MVFMVVISCDRPICEKENPVFDEFNNDSKEYVTELVLISQIN